MTTHYNYILAGGGMAGLSLAYYLCHEPQLRDKQILVIDRDAKNKNDRTWCFWEKGNGTFEQILFRKWEQVYFKSDGFEKLLDMDEYSYKMIRGIDFYDFTRSFLQKQPNVRLLQANVLGINNATVSTSEGDFVASEWVFDSVYRPSEQELRYHNLLQHFKGWRIKTPNKVFDPRFPTMMNFQIAQHNECRFIYVLPISETEAMIEFTVFGAKLMQQAEYDTELKDYLKNALQLVDYEVLEEEFGVIPMSDQPLSQRPEPQVLRIGTAGGYVKASSGYTFTRSQKYLQNIVAKLAQGQTQMEQKRKSRFDFYDSVLLNIMLHNKYPSDKVFMRLFKYNRASAVFRFLDEENHLFQDFRLMATLPIITFSRAALSVIFKKNV